MAAHLLHVPARDHAAERVTDDGDSRSRGDAIDQRAELLRDAPDADAGRMGERGDARAGLAFQPGAERTEDAGACEKTVDEDHDVVAMAGVRKHRRQIAGDEHGVAQKREPLGSDQRLDGRREHHGFKA